MALNLPIGPVSAGPLFTRIGGKPAERKRFQHDLALDAARVTNWRKRGIPAKDLPRVAAWLNMSVEEYLSSAGALTVEPPRAQYSLEGAQLMRDYEALPPALQAYIARKAALLRAYSDSLPKWVRDSLRTAPSDPAKHRDWEREIEADMLRLNHSGHRHGASDHED